jgi:hypothetical protein
LDVGCALESSTYNAQDSLGQVQPPTYTYTDANGQQQTVTPDKLDEYLAPTQAARFTALNNNSTDTTSVAYQLKQLYQSAFPDAAFPNLGKSITYNAADYVPYKFSTDNYSVVPTAPAFVDLRQVA